MGVPTPTKTIITTKRRKVKITTEETTTTTTTTSKKKRSPSKAKTEKKAKKVYSKAGQKKETPGEMNGELIFYESLYKEQADSTMAEVWLMEHGCFDAKKQEALAKIHCKTKA